jgi:hypothetical protein
LFIDETELFVPFTNFPWFKEASIAEITRVELPSPHHLYWPDLDIDLALDSIQHPERYPLVSKVQPDRPLQPPPSRLMDCSVASASLAEADRRRRDEPRQAQSQIEAAVPRGSRLSGSTLDAHAGSNDTRER